MVCEELEKAAYFTHHLCLQRKCSFISLDVVLSLIPRRSERRGRGGEKKSTWYLLHMHALHVNVRLFDRKIFRLCFDNVVVVILDHTLVITSSA